MIIDLAWINCLITIVQSIVGVYGIYYLIKYTKETKLIREASQAQTKAVLEQAELLRESFDREQRSSLAMTKPILDHTWSGGEGSKLLLNYTNYGNRISSPQLEYDEVIGKMAFFETSNENGHQVFRLEFTPSDLNIDPTITLNYIDVLGRFRSESYLLSRDRQILEHLGEAEHSVKRY